MNKNSILKKIILINLVFAFSAKINCCISYDSSDDNNNYKSKHISENNLVRSVEKACSHYIKKTGYNPKSNKFPNKLLSEYKLNINQVLQESKSYIKKNNHTQISYDKVKEIAEKKLTSLKQALTKITLPHDIENKVDQLISSLANTYLIPYAEYQKQKRTIIKDLQKMIREDKRNYFKNSEIKKQIREKFEYYLNENDPYYTDEYVYPEQNTAPYANTNINAPKTNLVYPHELDQKILEVATYLTSIKATEIPEWIASAYSEKIQTIKIRLKSLNSFYLTIENIIRISKEELQPIIDKINHQNEFCTICKNKYQTNDTISTLNCNAQHFFHKSCIDQWLNSDDKQSCPLCKQQNVIVAKIQNAVPIN